MRRASTMTPEQRWIVWCVGVDGKPLRVQGRVTRYLSLEETRLWGTDFSVKDVYLRQHHQAEGGDNETS